jgi:tetratricopeptide (TPR) repeat protein
MILSSLVAAATMCIAGTAYDKDLAPLYCPATADAKKEPLDGRKLTFDNLPKGFAKTRLRIAVRFLERRNENLETAGKIVTELEEVMRTVDANSDREVLRKKLVELSGARLDEAEAALLKAVDLEKKRLVLMRKVSEAAFKDKKKLSEVDAKLVDRLLKRYKDGEPEKVTKQYVIGLRLVAKGLINFLDDDLVGAVATIKTASKQCPNLAVAFLYLGSFSYIMDRPEAAVAAWRRVLELEPKNDEVRSALKSLGVSTKSTSPRKKKPKKRK